MSSNVDKFFKEKLGSHSIPPVPHSWEKVESRLSKKNSRSVVLRVAAAVALVGGFVMFIISQTGNEITSPSPLATKDLKSVPAVAASPGSEALKDSDKALPDNHDRTQRVARQAAKKIVQPRATPEPEQVVMEVPAQDLTAETVQPREVKSKRIVLVYSLPAIEKKADADAVALATSDVEKRTGLQKVMDVALEVKSGDNPLGELREAKDELFALEFRKDKNKGKNH